MGALLAIVSSALWGTADFIGGNATRRLPSFAVYGWSMLVGAIALAVASGLSGAWAAPPGYWPWSLLAAVSGLVGMNAFYRALALGPMGIIAPLVSLSVVVPVVVGLVGGESPNRLQAAGMIAAIIGVLLASGPELTGAESVRSLAYAAVAMVSFGVIFIAFARGSEISPLMTITGMRIISVLLCAVALMFIRSTGGVRRSDLPALASVGLLDAGANVMFAFATTMGLLSVVSVLGSLYPVVTAVLAAVLLKERLRAVQYAGVGSAMLGVLMLSAGST